MKLHARMLAVRLFTYFVNCEEINGPSKSVNPTESKQRKRLGWHLQSLTRVGWPECDRQINKSHKINSAADNHPSTD